MTTIERNKKMDSYTKLQQFIQDNFDIHFKCDYPELNHKLFDTFLTAIDTKSNGSICVESNNLGRCFSRYTYLVVNEDQENWYKGNYDNFRIIKELDLDGNHFVLYSTNVDSGD